MSSQQQQGRGKKSRIVIDVAQAQAEARARRGGPGARRRRILSIAALAVAGVVLLVLVGGYAWWQSYKKSPAYSLALLVDAAQRDDMPGVETLIDSDRVAQGFIPQVIEKLTVGGGPVPALPRGVVTAALPQLLPRVRETMREEIASAVKGFAESAGGEKPFLLLALGVPRVADIKEEGDAAQVSFKAGERPVELSMQRAGERWKVVAVKDEGLATGIASRLASSLPTTQPQTQPTPRRRQGR
ncbi:MAG TPA: hypothetical protein VFS10_02305 [Pyrinomonadaceae bacterium]|nr:hypothetical protein [Pyrinomonadaceae bacterium]